MQKWGLADILASVCVLGGLLLTGYGIHGAGPDGAADVRPALGAWGMAASFFSGAYFLRKRDRRALGYLKWMAILFAIPGGLLTVLYAVLLFNGPVPVSAHAILLVASILLAASMTFAVSFQKLGKDPEFNN